MTTDESHEAMLKEIGSLHKLVHAQQKNVEALRDIVEEKCARIEVAYANERRITKLESSSAADHEMWHEHEEKIHNLEKLCEHLGERVVALEKRPELGAHWNLQSSTTAPVPQLRYSQPDSREIPVDF